jgi:SAM-dependent methyltransferase
VVGDRWTFYAGRFDTMIADGTDLEGEARLVDAIAPRGASVLDAGCGTGRIAAALQRMGHHAIGVDKDAGLIQIAQQRYPGVPYLARDLLGLQGQALLAAGGPDEFDVIVLPGNVMVYLAPGTEREVLRGLAGLLRPSGRLLAGFATDRDYSPAEFRADAESVGLRLDHQFATWDLEPYDEQSDWLVAILRRPANLTRVETTSWPEPD